MLKSTLMAATVVAFSAAAASAARIDFTDSNVWVDGNSTQSIAGVTVSVAPVGTINFTQKFDGTPGETDGLAELSDGLGVSDDEISAPRESVTVSFSQTVRVIGLHFLDLFLAQDGSELEDALVSFNGGPLVEFNALKTPNPKNGGYAFYGFGPIAVNTITFTAGTTNDRRGVPDYALAAIDLAPIPLPAAGWMFISALAGMGFLARRRQTA